MSVPLDAPLAAPGTPSASGNAAAYLDIASVFLNAVDAPGATIEASTETLNAVYCASLGVAMPDDDEPLTVLRLTIEAALLPDWFEALKPVVARFARRMAVIEKPDEYVVQVELAVAKKEAFTQALQVAWTEFNERPRGIVGEA